MGLVIILTITNYIIEYLSVTILAQARLENVSSPLVQSLAVAISLSLARRCKAAFDEFSRRRLS